jgi:hypothetical protein
MAIGDSNLAGLARVSYEAVGLAQFKNENAQAEASYRSSTQGMSDEAIKLELAQDRLRRSLQKGPAAYREQARAELSVRNAERQLRGETDALGRSVNRTQNELGRFSRGAVAGSGVFRGLGRSLAFASGAFLGGTGLVYAIRTSISAAIAQDKILANLRNSLHASGISWEQYGAQIEQATQKTKALSAFDDEDLFASLQRFIRSTGDVTESLKLNALAADVARGANVSLEQSSKAILRAYNGQTAGLSRLGVSITKGVSGTKALEEVQKHFAGAAEAFGDSAAGATARFEVGLHDLEKAIGRGVLPEFTRLTKIGADWLNQADNQKRVERDVAQVTEQLAKGVHGLADGLRDVKAVVGPVNDLLGGTERSVKLVLEAVAVYKIAKIALAIRSMGVAFGFVGASATAAAAETVAAENAIGAGAVANAGRVGLLARAGLGFGPITVGITAGLLLKSIAQGRNAQSHAATMAQLRAAASAGDLTVAQVQALPAFAASKAEKQELIRLISAHDAIREPGEGRLGGTTTAPSGSTPRAAAGPRARTLVDILLDQARASTTATDADDLRYHREAASLIERQIAALKARGVRTKKQKEELTGLYNDLDREQSAIASIIDSREAAAAKKREDEQRKREERRKRERERIDKLVESAERASERHAKRVGDTGHDRASMRAKALAGVKATIKGLKDDTGKGLTAAEVHRMQFDFLTTLTGEIGQWGSNFQSESDSGQVATNSHLTVQQMRDLNASMHRLIEGTWHPGAQLASADLSAAGWGVGF